MSRERTDEEVKRLAPKQEVLRELYIKSGNECAYPGCHNVLVDENGKILKDTSRNKRKLRYSEDGNKILLTTKKSQEEFLKLLDDSFLISELTKYYYASMTKKKG